MKTQLACLIFSLLSLCLGIVLGRLYSIRQEYARAETIGMAMSYCAQIDASVSEWPTLQSKMSFEHLVNTLNTPANASWAPSSNSGLRKMAGDEK